MDDAYTPQHETHYSYKYVGSRRILEEADLNTGGAKISGKIELLEWIQRRHEEMVNGAITATFVINGEEELIISGRHTEHVMCAKGQDVLSAGEVVFLRDGKEVYISEISNQSTGYCPKPESWSAVKIALEKIGIDYPEYFTSAYDFRFCYKCESINLIKDGIFECLVCDSELDLEWNFEKQ